MKKRTNEEKLQMVNDACDLINEGMRDILFRGKRLDNGEWVYGNLFLSDTDGGAYILAGSRIVTIEWEVDPSTVGQYTGLLDKNGERIFEGDVLTVDGEDGFFVLEFQEDTARFVMSGDSIVVDFDNFWSYEVEVMGNIHDSPEFLEGGASE